MLRRKLEDVFKGMPLETPEMPLWSFSFHKSSSDKLFAEVSSWPVILLDVGNTAMTQSEPCPPRHTQRRVSSTHPARCPTGNTSPEPVPQIHTRLRNRSLHPQWARGGLSTHTGPVEAEPAETQECPLLAAPKAITPPSELSLRQAVKRTHPEPQEEPAGGVGRTQNHTPVERPPAPAKATTDP